MIKVASELESPLTYYLDVWKMEKTIVICCLNNTKSANVCQTFCCFHLRHTTQNLALQFDSKYQLFSAFHLSSLVLVH